MKLHFGQLPNGARSKEYGPFKSVGVVENQLIVDGDVLAEWNPYKARWYVKRHVQAWPNLDVQ